MLSAATLALVMAALGAGLLAGVHCAAMCGGIAGAQQLAAARLPADTTARIEIAPSRSAFARRALWRALPFNGGRIATYALLGALAGAAGGVTTLHDFAWLSQAVFVLANVLLILMGLSLAGVLRFTQVLEQAGGQLWAGVRPLAAAWLADGSPAHRIGLGLLWGLMPCALVYSMLLTALATGSTGAGALVMLAFGIGTLPNLLAMSLAWAWPARYGNLRIFAPGTRAAFRLGLALLVAGFGVFGLLRLPAIIKLHGLTALCLPGLA